MISSADMDLVREYARSGSEEAFAALVQRHINLAYSVALRRVGNPHHAQEICQAVFIILARKAPALPRGTVLSGWIYETTRLTASNFLRGEIRRIHREQEAHMQSLVEPTQADAWAQVAPMLDLAMAELSPKDRNAVVLRFFETRSFEEVAGCLGTSEPAAKMRVNRAVEKLRKFFLRRGVSLSAAAICGAVTAHSVQAAPAGLAASISVAALNGSATTLSTLTLIKTTIKIMAWTKAKTTIAIAAGILIFTGTATVGVNQFIEHRTYPWQVRNLSSAMLDRFPPQVHIVPSKFPNITTAVGANDKILGIGQPFENILITAYRGASPSRTIASVALPEGKFDYIANLPQDSRAGLQQEIKKHFGLSVAVQSRETNVLRLTVKTPNAAGLRPSQSPGGSSSSGSGQFSCANQPLSCLAATLENQLNIPIVDETGLTGTFDIDLNWDQSDAPQQPSESLKQALLDDLGLELTPAKMPIDMLVIQQAR